MIRDFSLVDDISYNCLDSIISSVVKSKGYDYELMFMYSWNFEFNRGKPLISEGLAPGWGDIRRPLYKYQGIKFTCKNDNPEEALHNIEEEIDEGNSVILETNIYWCPWNSRYRKVVEPHYTIILGIDRKKRILHCIDKTTWYKYKGPDLLPFEDFFQGYKSYTLMSCSKNSIEIDWQDVVCRSVLFMKSKRNYLFLYIQDFLDTIKCPFFSLRKLLIKKTGTGTFDDMRSLAAVLKSVPDFNSEIKDGMRINDLPLLKRFADIGNGRAKYAYTLKFLGERYEVAKLIELSSQVKAIGWRWQEVSYWIYEILNGKNPEERFNNCFLKINEIADLEEKLVEDLLTLVLK